MEVNERHGSAGFVQTRLLAVLLIAVQGCSGGDGDPPPEPGPDPGVSLNEASRLAARATFGLSYEDIQALAEQGSDAWLALQFELPVNLHKTVVSDLLARSALGEFDAIAQEDFEFLFRRFAWWHTTVTSSDVLRQRVAFALSEIFVVSEIDALVIDPYALSDYYDMLLTNAFGNFRDLLRAVTLHPSMGLYLSHINNRKADPERNTFPDENYAREVMQLFSIGLFELNVDGSRKLNGDGDPIPTYSNTEIREFAKVFTGLSLGGPNAAFGSDRSYFLSPMVMFEEFHEPGEKRLLNNFVIPDGQTGMADIEDAIDNLFMHPNVGPFIGKQLIQRLVTSNPSPAYIGRVAQAFNGDATGVRGDMKAVIEAILLDPEALAEEGTIEHFGKVREPVVRYTSLLRQFKASSPDNFYASTGVVLQELTLQHPLSAPSVFNFFLPSHTPPGEIADTGLVAPELQITTSSTIAGITNLVDFAVNGAFVNDFSTPPFSAATLDTSDYVAIANDVDALIDRLDTVLTYGTLSAETRTVDARRTPIVGASGRFNAVARADRQPATFVSRDQRARRRSFEATEDAAHAGPTPNQENGQTFAQNRIKCNQESVMKAIKRTLVIAMTALLLSAGTIAHAQTPEELKTMEQFLGIMAGYFNVIESSHQFASDAEKSAILQMHKIQEVYEERGEKAKAAEIFRQVLENSQNPTIRNAAFVLLGDLLKETGRTDEAVTVLREGLAENLKNAN